MTEIRSAADFSAKPLASKNNDMLYDEDGVYIGPPSEYNEFGIDTRTGEPFYGMR